MSYTGDRSLTLEDGLAHYEDMKAKQREAQTKKSLMLAQLAQLRDAGRVRDIMPTLLSACDADPVYLRIHLWTVEAAMTGCDRKTALKTVRRTRRIVRDSTTQKTGLITVEWAVGSQAHSDRLYTWLWLIGQRKHWVRLEIPYGFPYQLMYATEEDWRRMADGTSMA